MSKRLFAIILFVWYNYIIMAYTKEQQKRYGRQYRQTHKEELRKAHREYAQTHQKHISEHMKEYFRTHKEQLKITKARYQQKLKVAVLMYYGSGKLACVKCGFTDVRALSIDHINDNGAQHRKELIKHNQTGAWFYLWLKRNNYPEGYQTLCMNCQWIKRLSNSNTTKMPV